MWLNEPTEANARTVAAQMPDAHDSRWDNREAIVFLEAEQHFQESGTTARAGPILVWLLKGRGMDIRHLSGEPSQQAVASGSSQERKRPDDSSQ